jgi:hypothetical protein
MITLYFIKGFQINYFLVQLSLDYKHVFVEIITQHYKQLIYLGARKLMFAVK